MDRFEDREYRRRDRDDERRFGERGPRYGRGDMDEPMRRERFGNPWGRNPEFHEDMGRRFDEERGRMEFRGDRFREERGRMPDFPGERGYDERRGFRRMEQSRFTGTGGYGDAAMPQFGEDPGTLDSGRQGYDRPSFSGRGPRGWHRADDRIREDVCEALTDCPDVDASDVTVSVENGEVTLTGTVDSRQSKRYAEDLAERVRGVHDVHNHLSVRQGFLDNLFGGKSRTCRDLMTEGAQCCLPTDTAQAAAQIMKTEDVGPVPVVESHESKKLVGIVTDRDLALRIVAEGQDARRTTLDGVMTRDPATVHPDDDASRALDVMRAHQVRRVPVVDTEGRLVGIIAQADIARHFGDRKTGDLVEDLSTPAQQAAERDRHTPRSLW